MTFLPRRTFLGIFIITCCLILASCAAPPRTKLSQALLLGTDAKIAVGDITATAPEKYDVDVRDMLRTALEKSLAEKQILKTEGSSAPFYTLDVNITDYEMGNAFKRWLMPFYGSTVLKVECELLNGASGESVTRFDHEQSIVAGGLYTVGGWKYIFNTVANDLASDLQRRTSDTVEGFHIALSPWPPDDAVIARADVSRKINLLPLRDLRPDKSRIGERHAAFQVSMGNVYFNRDVASYLSEALRNDLLAAGNQVTDEGQDITLAGEVTKFWVHTNTTPLYWDVVGEIELKLSATDSRNPGKTIEKIYSGAGTTRTYLWPSEEIVSQSMSKGLEQLMSSIRAEKIWAPQ